MRGSARHTQSAVEPRRIGHLGTSVDVSQSSYSGTNVARSDRVGRRMRRRGIHVPSGTHAFFHYRAGGGGGGGIGAASSAAMRLVANTTSARQIEHKTTAYFYIPCCYHSRSFSPRLKRDKLIVDEPRSRRERHPRLGESIRSVTIVVKLTERGGGSL